MKRRISFMLAAILFAVQLTPWRTPAAQADSPPPPPVVEGWVLVSTAEQLAYMNQHQPDYVTSNIRLMNDIDLSGVAWVPFGGNDNAAFSGTFDGRGHLISGVEIDSADWEDPKQYENVGFFGKVTGTVQQLRLGVQVSGGANTGGVAGLLTDGGKILFTQVTGSVATVSVNENTHVTGGLVGATANSTISHSSSAAAVMGGYASNIYTGGLVGSQGAGLIENSYATGAIGLQSSAGMYVYYSGGLAGFMIYGTIEASYAAGKVSGGPGGPNSLVAGLVGQLGLGTAVLRSHFDTETTEQSVGIAAEGDGAAEAAGHPTAEMVQAATYAGWDFVNTWAIHPAVNGGYPYLRPAMLTEDLASARQESAYAQQLEAYDGAGGGLAWQATGLPEGLALGSTGKLEGTPRESGSFDVTVTVTDAGGASAGATLRLVVDEPPSPDLGTVTGTVYGTGDMPLPGVTVTVDAYGISDTTRADGSFTLPNLPAGMQTVKFLAPGYKTRTENANVTAGAGTDLGRVVLEPNDPPSPPAGSGGSGGSGSSYVPVSPSPSSQPNKAKIKAGGRELLVTVTREKASDGRDVQRYIPDASELSALFASRSESTLEIDAPVPILKTDLPMQAIRDILRLQPDAVLKVTMNRATYSLPLRLWEGRPGTVLTVTIAEAAERDLSEFKSALTKYGYEGLADPVYFTLDIEGEVISDFEGTYVERAIRLDTEPDPANATVVWVDDEERLHFVPAVFRRDTPGAYAVFSAPHDSRYAVVRTNHAFVDLAGHWAEEDVNLLANKLILEGKRGGAFDPDGSVTRAEFAAMLARSLGLAARPTLIAFRDVPSDAWYAGPVNAAVHAGLVKGYEDGTFRPEDPITREQMAVMLANAAQFAGGLSAAESEVPGRFSDASDLACWAKDPLWGLLSAGLIQGVDETHLAPKAAATRAQSAVMLRRLLVYLNFID
ncbi:S-layer homology domain-containing protein [uncultured Paenibacillus sp.]|uniref:S-layer homology domain-containing protein n=1 Tax=uncultured Paenibacillus sp. TaxID=227322 RepID=UPI0015B0512D|nr:S-layer homology domain-containing protein [uncultured Paenibacillus sp.]